MERTGREHMKNWPKIFTPPDWRQSIWNTWCTIGQAWDLLLLPIMDELVLAVGASLKHGGYWSCKNYFSRAMQEHRAQYVTPTSATEYDGTYRQSYSVHQPWRWTYCPQRLLWIWTVPHSVTPRREGPRSLVPPHRSGSRHHHDLLLVAATWYRSSRSQDATRVHTPNSEERRNRDVSQ